MSKPNTRAIIDANIRQNGQQLIAGQVLNATLNAMVTDYAEQAALDGLKEKVDALALGAFYGYFPNTASLPTDVTTPGYAYVGSDNPYEIWNFNGESWSNSGTSIDMNDADEEDITRNADGKLQFKDRSYGGGMAYVILRKDKTFAEQVTQANTIYEIRYNFTLESSFSMPSNCVLRFIGGTITGGTIVGNNTRVESESHGCFSSSTILSGTWTADLASSAWFSFTSDCVLDDSLVFVSGTNNAQCLKNLLLFPNIIMERGTYYVDGRFYLMSGQTFNGNGATLKCKYANKYAAAFEIQNLKNVSVSNLIMIGWKQETSEVTEFAHGLNISGSENVMVENVSCLYFRGDGFNVSYYSGVISQNITMSNIISRYNHRQGLSITGVDLMSVTNSEFSYTSGTEPQAGVDIEPNAGEYCKRIVMENIKCLGNIGSGIILGSTAGDVEDVSVKDYYHESSYGVGIDFWKCAKILFDGFILKTNKLGVVFDDSTYEKIGLKNGVIIGNGQKYNGVFFASTQPSKGLDFIGLEVYGFNGFGFYIPNTAIIDGIVMRDIFVHNCYNNILINGDNLTNVDVSNVRSANVGKDVNGETYPDWSFGWGRKISTDPKTLIDHDCSANGDTEKRPSLASYYVGRCYFDTTLGKMIFWNGSRWVDADGFISDSLRVGTTEQRPTSANIASGFQYFDTTLGKPIFYNGTKWVDATGADA